jgi:hypothetical protein
MSFGTKLCNNPNILMAKDYQIDGGGQFANSLVAHGGGLATTKEISDANASCSVDALVNGGINFVRVDPKGHKPHRYLPYEQNGLTFVTLGAGARLLLSGPINGCHIYVVQNAGGPVTVMHVNWNNIPTNNPANILLNSAYKLGLANALRATLPGAPPITNTLLYQPAHGTTDYHQYLGFVVGRKTGHAAPWNWWVYGIGGPLAAPTILRAF